MFTLQAEQLMRMLMQQERRRLWNWWDDTRTRNTENSRGRCACHCPSDSALTAK